MKFSPSIVSYFFQKQSTRQDIRRLLSFLIILGGLVTAYSIIFHFLMALEGRDHSWVTGFYWTLTVMSTLGFGDITFQSDPGRVFSIIVLLSGMIFLLTLLPFTFITFFYAPWIEAEARKRTPRELPEETQGHVIITNYDPIAAGLIEKLKTYNYQYIVIVEELKHAQELYDLGVRVALGEIDNPETYRRLRVDRAALVVATHRDEINTNIAFTVRELSERVAVVATAESPHSVDILEMAGSTKVLQVYDILGRSLAAWTVGGQCRANVISRFGELIIAEFPAMGTPLVGQTLAESRLRENFGVNVVGLWSRGTFSISHAASRIDATSVLVMACSEKSLAAFEEIYSFYHICKLSDPVLIIGGGRVGECIAALFRERGSPYLIVEKEPGKFHDDSHYVFGDAADLRTLQKAWVEKAPAALVTTHDDAVNIYLTKYLRSLRPDLQILSRANLERNVSTLHRAGADFVMSYASLGANAFFNFLKREDMSMLIEGLNIFRVKAPEALIGKKLVESEIREKTECSVVAVQADGAVSINPDPQLPIHAGSELILIGTDEGEKKFLRFFAE